MDESVGEQTFQVVSLDEGFLLVITFVVLLLVQFFGNEVQKERVVPE
jgi:hypothetical protein